MYRDKRKAGVDFNSVISGCIPEHFVDFSEAKYNSIEEVAAALKRREVRGAMVDVFSAATRSDLFNHSDITAKRLFKYPSAFGFVLSGDMKNAASKFRDYLAVNANEIHKTIRSRTSGLEV